MTLILLVQKCIQSSAMMILVLLVQKCIRGLLKEKTILLVTHQVEFLSRADLVVVRD